MRLFIELRDRTRTCWTPLDNDPDTKYAILDAWNRWQVGASMEQAGNWAFALTEDLSDLGSEEMKNAAPALFRRVEIHEIGSILAMAE